MTSDNEGQSTGNKEQMQGDNAASSATGKVTHNLDTGEDEPLEDLKDENIMDFGSGSGGGGAGDGGAS